MTFKNLPVIFGRDLCECACVIYTCILCYLIFNGLWLLKSYITHKPMRLAIGFYYGNIFLFDDWVTARASHACTECIAPTQITEQTFV